MSSQHLQVSMPRTTRISYLQVRPAPQPADLSLVNDNSGVSYLQDLSTLTCSLLVSEPQPRPRARPPWNNVISFGPGNTNLWFLGPQNKSMVKPFQIILIIFLKPFQKHFKLISITGSKINLNRPQENYY